MNAQIVSSLARHVLTAIGGGLAMKYGMDGDTLNAIIGGISAAVGFGWSVYEKKAA